MNATLAPTVGDAIFQDLREAIHGEVLRPGDDRYLEACRVWNGAFDERRPVAVVRCSGAADVITAVGFARVNGLPLAVRGGGHSIAGFSSVQDGVVIDLSAVREVRVDPYRRRAQVGAGATWADVDRETQAHGLATTGGLISTTGVAGFTLGGGIGWLMRKHGLACDNLVGADVVTADGQLVHATAEENSDLLWGLRGGGNFGVVTRFELDLHPVGPLVSAGPIFFPAEHDVELTRVFRDWAQSASNDITAVLNLMTAPPLPAIPERWHGRKVIALIALSVGPPEEAEAHLSGFREAFEAIADLFGPMPYRTMQSLLDPLFPKGTHAYFKATNLGGLDDELIEGLHDLHMSAPGPQCEIHLHQMGGAVAAPTDGSTAYPERAMPFVLNAVTSWQQPNAAEAHVRWARAVIDAASEASTGRSYVNYLGDTDAARSSYGAEKYAALQALKRKYDPANLFRLNQNIRPDEKA